MSERVIVMPYDPRWKDEYASESLDVTRCLGDNVFGIHHIGSTAIPGIHAKPIIDILVEVRDIGAVDACNHLMEDSGYEPMGEFGIRNRRYFRKDNALGVRSHHVHVFQAGDAEVTRHLNFRDYLRATPIVAREYSDLKRSLAVAHPEDIKKYMEGKNAFIKHVIARAEIWRQEARAREG
jgi:GrpB-like predicted nucleotidyltransferase (UPF0157 family)